MIVQTRSIHDATSVKSLASSHSFAVHSGLFRRLKGLGACVDAMNSFRKYHTDAFVPGLESVATLLCLAGDDLDPSILQNPKSEIPTLFSSVRRRDRATIISSIAIPHHDSGGALSVALEARKENRDVARVAPASELGIATRGEPFHDLYVVRAKRLAGYHE